MKEEKKETRKQFAELRTGAHGLVSRQPRSKFEMQRDRRPETEHIGMLGSI